MKRRYLPMLLAVIAATLLLVLPGAALATQYVTLPGDSNTVWFDLDTNQSVFQGEDTDLTYWASPAEYGNFGFVLRGSGFFTMAADYDLIGWADVYNGALGVEPQAGMTAAPYSFVVITKSGTCFKGLVTAIDVSHVDFQYDQITPDNGTLVDVPWNSKFDLETGAVTDEGYDLSFSEVVDQNYQSTYSVTTPGEAGSAWAASSVSYDSLATADLQGMTFSNQFQVWDGYASPPVAAVRTSLGHYFKLIFLSNGFGCVLLYQQLASPDDPPTMLNDLKGFIGAPTTGTVDPLIAPSLTAKVNAALAALARNNENDAKVAMNDLRALVNQVEAQTDKKISPEAAAEIIAQANAIITALGY